ncbi:hypothetical protein VOLCADRAFT_87503 [Volvox carteri f. nagariensis]|uniref:Uncharacterized protein n=1 Tax=Volvox carteri f. nagariensis TaxID=3068 RepID=D8TLH1_VOLCA|nr:uncharacterized protein VOLCADRAFT_87503 [Volvox carteri f. nagariensis]EFJ51734.1 hypothetical protein VOLCADRAFT_87503 [Volvox carteri f. nagariensis]|eukprot:XP_002947144.1 hypothetical protein VOLCADRAFT_87503 [Volvox carteri f. nagariensis]
MADNESSGGDQGRPNPPPSKKRATLKLSDLWGSGGKPASQPVPTKKVDDKPCKEVLPHYVSPTYFGTFHIYNAGSCFTRAPIFKQLTIQTICSAFSSAVPSALPCPSLRPLFLYVCALCPCAHVFTDIRVYVSWLITSRDTWELNPDPQEETVATVPGGAGGGLGAIRSSPPAGAAKTGAAVLETVVMNALEKVSEKRRRDDRAALEQADELHADFMASEQKVPRDVIGHRLQAFAGFHLGLQLIRSYLDAGCYEKATEWTDRLQLHAEIGMEVTHQLASEPRIGLTAADHCFNNIIGTRIPKVMAAVMVAAILMVLEAPAAEAVVADRAAATTGVAASMEVMSTAEAVMQSALIAVIAMAIAARKAAAASSGFQALSNLDPAPVPASLATHWKQPARLTVAPEGVKVEAPGEFWKDKGEFSSPTFDNTSGSRSSPVAGPPSVPHQMRGRLSGKKGAWKAWVVNALVISWITSGFPLRWVSSPPPQHSGRNHASATANAAFVDKAVADLVVSGTAHLDARAEALLGALGTEADAELSTLATQFAQVAGQTLAPRTSNDYARSWEPFREWWMARRLPGSIYDTPGEAVALNLLSLLNSSKEDKVGPGRVRTASAAISSYFRLASRAPPTEHPACSIVRDLAEKQLQGRKLEHDALEPADVTVLARLVSGPEPPLDQLMTVTAVVVMFAGFFRFDDAAEISIHEDLLVITATGMDVFIPRSKTDQQRQGHWVPIARVGGATCPMGLTERLLTLGGYKRRPDTPDEDVGPLLRPVQWNRAGGYLSGPLTGTVAQPIHSLSYPAFCHRLNKTLQAAGITRRITAHSMRIGGNSTAADRGVPADLRKVHGRWCSDAMVQHYTRRDGEAKLSVSRSLGLANLYRNSSLEGTDQHGHHSPSSRGVHQDDPMDITAAIYTPTPHHTKLPLPSGIKTIGVPHNLRLQCMGATYSRKPPRLPACSPAPRRPPSLRIDDPAAVTTTTTTATITVAPHTATARGPTGAAPSITALTTRNPLPAPAPQATAKPAPRLSSADPCYPTTGVTLCEAAYFTHPRSAPSSTSAAVAAAAAGPDSSSGGGGALQQPNLIVVRTNRLEVHSLRSSAVATNAAAATATAAATASAAVGSGGARLELVVSYHLHGVVESLAVLSGGSSSRRDALLLAFREGKLSVVEWNPRTHSLRTSSLHYFEGDPGVQREGRIAVPLPPRVVTDPAGRCAAMSFCFSQLALLPALEVKAGAWQCVDDGGVMGVGRGERERIGGVHINERRAKRERNAGKPAEREQQPERVQADPLMDLGPNGGGGGGGGGGGVATLGNGYLLNLNKMMGIREVRDCVFLHGYTEPVLLLLHEPDPTWVGMLRERKDTCCLAAISISLRLKRHTILWKLASLPYDCFKLLAVPYRPAVLVISPNLLLLCSQASQHAAALNSNALPGEVPPPLILDPSREPPAATAARLAAQYALNVHPDCAPAAGRNATLMADLEVVAAGLQSGTLLAVHLQFEGPADQRITVVRTGGGPIASAMVGITMAAASRTAAATGVAVGGGGAAAAMAQPYVSYRGPKGFMFLGSWSGDSVLMQLRPKKPAAAAEQEDGAGGSSKDLKRNRGQAGDGDGDGDGVATTATNRSAAVAAAAAAFAATAAAADAAGAAPRYNLRLLDSLPSMGPVRDLLFADTSVSSYTASSGGGPETSRGGPTCFACVGQSRAQTRQTASLNIIIQHEGQTGAIVMARQGLIPDVLTEVNLPSVAGVFAVYHRTEDDGDVAVAFNPVDGADGAAPAAPDDDNDDGEADGGRRATVELTPEPPEVDVTAGDVEMPEAGGVKTEPAPPHNNNAEPGPIAIAPATEADLPASPKKARDVVGGGGGGRNDGAAARRQAPPSSLVAGEPPPPQRPTGPPFHAYLLITMGRVRTMVLRCTDGLDDVTNSPECEFLVNQPTLAAGNLFHNAVIVQACPMGLRVLEGMTLVQELRVSDFQASRPKTAQYSFCCRTKHPIAHRAMGPIPQAADPYVLVGLSDGTAVLLEGDPLSLTLGVATAAAEQLMAVPARSRQQRLAAACLHRDETSWMASATAAEAASSGSSFSIFLWICRLSGRLECYSLPSMRLVFHSSGLAAAEEVLRMGPAVMYDVYDLFGGGGGGAEAELDGGGGSGIMEDPVVELRVESFLGGGSPAVPDCERPVLLVMAASGNLVAYQIALRRLPLDSLSHEAPAAMGAAAGSSGGGGGIGGGAALGPRMARFDHLAYTDPSSKSHSRTDIRKYPVASQGTSYSGVFVAGSRPLWLVASRGGLVPHPMFAEGAVAAMTPFHNANCPLGFISACSSRGLLKVCQLPPHTRLDTPWVTRRVPLRVTPHKLAWFRDAGLMAAITSRVVVSRPRPPEEPGGDAHAAAAYAAAAAAAAGRGREEAWELRLLEPNGCGRLWLSPLLPPGEQALCLKVIYLQNATTGDTDALLAVGTGSPMGQLGGGNWRFRLPRGRVAGSGGLVVHRQCEREGAGRGCRGERPPGEDYPCLGRILLYTISAEVVDLGGGNLTRRWSAVLVATRDMASAVTSVQEFKSQLLVTCGSRIEMYEWRGPAAGASGGGGGGPGGRLEKRAFFDLPSLVTSLVAVKDYLLAADASQGLYFVRYSDSARVLEFMSKDFDHRDVLTAGVVINEPKLAFLAADAAGNLALSEFYGSRNTNPEFWAGQRLAPLGLMHVARRLSCCVSIKMPTSDGKNRHALLCGAAEGGLSYIAPVPDAEMTQRLLALQNHMSRRLPHVAGLNPRAFRHRFCRIPKSLGGGQSHHAPPAPASNGLLDGQLLLGFPLLSRQHQGQAAEALGVTVRQIMSDLRAIITAATLC